MTDKLSQNITKYINEVGEKELKRLIEISDKNQEFTWSDFNTKKTPPVKSWGLAIEYGIIEKVDERNYRLCEEDIESSIDLTEIETDEITEENTSKVDDVNTTDNTEEDSITEDELPELNLSDTSWTKYDKLFGLVGVMGIISYSVSSLQNGVYSILNLPLHYLVDLLPFHTVLIILSSLTSLWAIIVREKIHDSSTENMRKHMKYLTSDSDKLLGLPDDATQEDEERLMTLQTAMMKSQIKPFGWIMAVTIPVLIWISVTVSTGVGETITFPLLGESAWSSPLIGPITTWLFWYILISIISNQVLKKTIKSF